MAKHIDQAEVVAQIYDAALDPGDSSALPRIFMRIGDGGSAVVAMLRSNGSVEIGSCEQPDEAEQQYSSYYRLVNPYEPIMAGIGPMIVRRDSELMPVLEYKQTEFYTDFARKFATEQLMGTSEIPLAPGVIVHLGIHRGGTSPFRARQVAAVQRVLPHLQRALQLRLRLGLSQTAALGYAALEKLAVGCVICDATGRVVFANAAAEAIASTGRGIMIGGPHGIAAADPAHTRQLAALVADAARGGSGGPMLLGSIRADGVFALIAPLPSRFGGLPGHALVTLRPADDAPGYSARLLGELFRLTPAEARLTLALGAGQSLSEFSDQRAVSENTVRSQLASVLRKTGAANQREVVRLLGLLPPVSLDRH